MGWLSGYFCFSFLEDWAYFDEISLATWLVSLSYNSTYARLILRLKYRKYAKVLYAQRGGYFANNFWKVQRENRKNWSRDPAEQFMAHCNPKFFILF